MTTVETRVVNPVHRSSVDVSEADMVDVAMNHEEDQILDDEEIDSCEGIDLESQMLTVALVKSVVDSGAQSGEKKDSPSSRYGLRKRRRPGDATSGDSSEVSDSILPQLSLSNGVKTQARANETRIKQETIPTTPLLRHQPLVMKQENGHATRGTKIKDHPILGKLQLASGTLARPVLTTATKPIAPLTKPGAVGPKRKPKRQPKGKGLVAKHELVPTSGAVPNPLSQATPQLSKVPRSFASRQLNGNPMPLSLPSAVPCPLQAPSMDASTEKKRVKISEPPVLNARPRVFSVDLDRE